MQAELNQSHFTYFKDNSANFGTWAATRIPRNWAVKVGAPDTILSLLSDAHVERQALKDLCADGSVSSEVVFISVMAWGGMKYDHGRLAWNKRTVVSSIIDQVRSGKISRSECYAKFRKFRIDFKNSGLGPAFFTKLIFFGHPQHEGYIMDQWTSLGINLIFSTRPNPIIKMNTGFYRNNRFDSVADTNTEVDYENFCQKIEYLSELLKISSEETEMRLFSNGGRNPGLWRQYVKDNRSKLKMRS